MFIKNGLLCNDLGLQFNNLGHRCTDIENLNFKNYILYLGDNVSLCLDKPIDQTFPFIVSKKLKMDYYNLSIFNGGSDSLKFNLLAWMNKFRQLPPRFIVITNEFINSLLTCDSSYNDLHTIDYDDENIKNLIYHANNCGFFSGRNDLLQNLIINIINIPVYQINLPNTEILLKDNNIFNIDVDSNDQIHISDRLYRRIVDLKRKVAP